VELPITSATRFSAYAAGALNQQQHIDAISKIHPTRMSYPGSAHCNALNLADAQAVLK
jgi:hypothetical protein